MLLIDIGELVKKRVYTWLRDKNISGIEVTIEVPSKEEYGDLSLSIAFKLAKIMGRNPVDIAMEISKFLLSIPYVEDVKVVKGYINIFLKRDSFHRDYIKRIIEGGIYFCRRRIGEGIVRLEYTSVNPNKALHIGHGRNVALGVALARMLEYGGYRVEKLNYIDDTGSQMADLILGFLYLGFDLDSREMRFDKYCGDIVYVKSYERIEESEELKSKRRDIIKLIEEGDNVVASFNRRIAELVLSHQLETCRRLGAEYDKLIWESDIIWSGLYKKGISVISGSSVIVRPNTGKYAGCMVAKISTGDEINPEVDDVIMRSDGTLTYLGKDVIFAMWKLGLVEHPLPFREMSIGDNGLKVYSSTWPEGELYQPSKCVLSINIIGIEQAKLQNIIKKIINDIYGSDESGKYIHYYYNHVWLSPNTARKYLKIDTAGRPLKMSGRRGIHVNIDDILDLMAEKALRLVELNNPGIDRVQAREIAERVAVSCLKFMLLSVDRDKVVVFDIDESLDITKESGAYVLYSYARARSILRRIGDTNINPALFNLDGLNEHDLRLLRYMSLIPLSVFDAIRNMEPKIVIHSMYRLAKHFNEFYERNPVIKSSGSVKNTRILIVKAYTIVMELLAFLLGIPLIEYM